MVDIISNLLGLADSDVSNLNNLHVLLFQVYEAKDKNTSSGLE